MKAVVEAEDLTHVVKTCATLLGAEIDLLITAIPKGFVRIEAGLNSSYVCHTLKADVEEKGKVVLPVQRLMGVPLTESVTLEQKGGDSLSFKSGAFSGSIRQGGESDVIIANRPEKRFKAKTALPTEVFKSALSRVNFRSALPGAQMGIRIQVDEDMTLSTTDQYRASIYKEELAIKQPAFDLVMQPDFLHGAVGRVRAPEVNIGVYRGVFHLSTDIMDIYHPSIQQDPEDIEDWLDNGIDYSKRECKVTLACSQFAEKIREVSSIQIGSLSYDTYFDLLVKGQKAYLRCNADHGSTKSSFSLFRSDATKTLTRMSSRYTLEMLHLIRAGDADLSFWDGFILFEGNEGKFRGLIPSVAS